MCCGGAHTSVRWCLRRVRVWSRVCCVCYYASARARARRGGGRHGCYKRRSASRTGAQRSVSPTSCCRRRPPAAARSHNVNKCGARWWCQRQSPSSQRVKTDNRGRGESRGGGAHGISRTRDKGGPSPRRTGEMGGGGGGARGRDEIQGRQHGWRSQPTMQRLCSNPILIVNTRNGQTRNSSFFEVVCLIVCIVGGVFVWCIV